MRYAAGLDSVVAAGGPDCNSQTGSIKRIGMSLGVTRQVESLTARRVEIQATSIRFKETADVIVTLEAQGDENAVGLSLNFNPAQFALVSVRKGSDGLNATLSVNDKHARAGILGIALALQPGQGFAPGTNQLVVMALRPLKRDVQPLMVLGDQAGSGKCRGQAVRKPFCFPPNTGEQ